MTVFLQARRNRVSAGVTHAHGRWKDCEKKKGNEKKNVLPLNFLIFRVCHASRGIPLARSYRIKEFNGGNSNRMKC